MNKIMMYFGYISFFGWVMIFLIVGAFCKVKDTRTPHQKYLDDLNKYRGRKKKVPKL